MPKAAKSKPKARTKTTAKTRAPSPDEEWPSKEWLAQLPAGSKYDPTTGRLITKFPGKEEVEREFYARITRSRADSRRLAADEREKEEAPRALTKLIRTLTAPPAALPSEPPERGAQINRVKRVLPEVRKRVPSSASTATFLREIDKELHDENRRLRLRTPDWHVVNYALGREPRRKYKK
jgi:hypothetical protein